MAGVSGKPLSQKLGLKPGFCIFVDGAPADYRELVGGLPEGAKIVTQPKAAGEAELRGGFPVIR
jgi:hypothetical protein